MRRSTLVMWTVLAALAVSVPARAKTEALDVHLRRAIMAQDLAGAAAALDKGASLDKPRGTPPLFLAARIGQKEMVMLLLERGAAVDTPALIFGQGGPTALSAAALDQRRELVELLLGKGASVQAAIDGLRRMSSTVSGSAQAVESYRRGIQLLEGLGGEGAAETAASLVPAAPARRAVPASLAPNFSGAANPDDYAVVIGVENYSDLPAAQFAERDAAAVRRFVAALGVPERNIATLTGARATKTGLEKTIEAWLPNNVSEKSRVFVFYSGHGAPDPKTGDAYLVPSDGDPQYLAQTGYPLKRLYAKLGELKARKVVVALDSCFSGAGGRSVLAKGTRPLVGRVDLSVGSGSKRIEVLSASGADQISGANDEAGYGLFTYNLLQGLNGGAKDASGRITVRSLYDYARPRVADQARRANREQAPQLQCEGEGAVLREK